MVSAKGDLIIFKRTKPGSYKSADVRVIRKRRNRGYAKLIAEGRAFATRQIEKFKCDRIKSRYSGRKTVREKCCNKVCL